MAKLLVLANGVVKVPHSGARAVSAYVALSAGAKSRVFRVRGSVDAPRVEELPAATTLDVQHFQTQIQADLQPVLNDARAEGAEGQGAHIELSRPEWVCVFVRDHLKTTEGLDIE